VDTRYGVLFLRCDRSSKEGVCEELWSIAECRGIEELPSESSALYVPSEDYEILEFGSEAAQRCAEWLESGDFQNAHPNIFLKVYLEFSFDEFPTLIDPHLRFMNKKNFELLSWNEIPNTNYLENYKKSVKGQNVGRRLWVGPPWDQAPADRKAIFVEPGMAFGTGDHPTTQMCLALLEELSEKIDPKKIVDVGTGSGVLAVAAAYFFPKAELIVSDLDPLCAQEFEKTFALNNLDTSRIHKIFGARADFKKFTPPQFQADLLISNIYAEVLSSLVPELAQLLKPQAFWVVSGLLEGGGTQEFEAQAQKFFDLKDSRSTKLERASLVAGTGLHKVSESWGARLFQLR
jgi:ribosomal protein L11 methyltransferase